MSQELEPAEALNLLVHEKNEANRSRDRQAEVCGYALEVLRSKGELVFTKDGLYGGTPGLIGSADSGILLTQATRPVVIGESFVSLRDRESSEERAVELVRLASPKPALVCEGTSLVAVAEHGKWTIPGVTHFEERHRLAVCRLIGVIDVAIEPLERPLKSLPRIIYHTNRGAPRMINIRENPETLAELEPGFRNLAKRVSSNFSH